MLVSHGPWFCDIPTCSVLVSMALGYPYCYNAKKRKETNRHSFAAYSWLEWVKQSLTKHPKTATAKLPSPVANLPIFGAFLVFLSSLKCQFIHASAGQLHAIGVTSGMDVTVITYQATSGEVASQVRASSVKFHRFFECLNSVSCLTMVSHCCTMRENLHWPIPHSTVKLLPEKPISVNNSTMSVSTTL